MGTVGDAFTSKLSAPEPPATARLSAPAHVIGPAPARVIVVGVPPHAGRVVSPSVPPGPSAPAPRSTSTGRATADSAPAGSPSVTVSAPPPARSRRLVDA